MTASARSEGQIVLDRADAEATIFRVAYCAFVHPQSAQPPTDLRTYMSTEVDWCLDPLVGLDDATLARLRDDVALLIVDPTANRRAFVTELYVLAHEPTP